MLSSKMKVGRRYMVERDGTWHEAEVLEIREVQRSPNNNNNPMPTLEYYVHYDGLNRRSDEWITENKFHKPRHNDDSPDEIIPTPYDRPKKPGKLDLRQFDNITTAIGKLNVQPLSSSPTSTMSPLLLTSNHSKSPKNSSKTTAISKQQSTTNCTHTPNRRRLNNLRHGRAVAPPTLPIGQVFKNPLGQLGSNEKSCHNRIEQANDERTEIDFSQSPIAQRLLKRSKDYKVSELNSPNGSDSEENQTGEIQNTLAQGLPKACKNEKSGPARGPFIDTSELINSRGETIRQLNEILARKPGPLGPNISRLTKATSNDQLLNDSVLSSKKDEKDSSKKDKKKLRSDEKLEKRRIKEEERLRRQEEERLRRLEKKTASKKSKSIQAMDSTGDDGIPLFIKCCIEFIEAEGLDAEGIYRVPGNRAHVEAFVHKFKENPEMSIVESDIPVNAVATALKDFLSKKWGPIIPPDLMCELTELSNISEKRKRVEAVKELVNKLPTANYKLLKYVFSHFVRISSNSTLNSMDSKNLAICWWPTLLPLQFNDMIMFERMRPHLEESIQTMIDQYEFVFANEQPGY